MYRFIWMCLQAIACCVSFICFAQDSTRVLDEVEIVGIDLSLFSSGTSIRAVKKNSSVSLAAIGDQSTIYFKNYGSQQLSTISLRGTSSSHTSVIWNGIPVNSPTLGQTDFSVWPMFLSDQVFVQKGGASSLFGSGAIGGAVILDNSNFQKDSLMSIYLGYGSFGQRDVGLRLQFHQKQIINETTIFGSLLDNDFKLVSGDRQKHASVNRLGVSNKLSYRHKRGTLFSEVAYAKNEREIQPTKTSSSQNTLESENIRVVLNNESVGIATHHSTIGFISDQTIFNDTSITTSYRVAATHAIERSIKALIFLRFGGTGIHEWAESGNFNEVEKQTQGHLFVSGTFLNKLGNVTINLRQAFYRNAEEFIPSIGIESSIIGDDKIQIRFRSQLSRDYRAPTFNDLYWRPGGNANLKSEKSLNYELGADLKFSNLNVGLTGFASHISNWIQWTPTDGIWSPQNIREVKTKGIETYSNANFSIGQTKIFLEAEYSYTLSTDKGLVEENQLPYVPKHSAMASAGLISNHSSIQLIGNYTGRRFTTLSNSRANRIDAFSLIDVQLKHRFLFGSTSIQTTFNIQNIADTNYENLKNTAMPGRAFSMELTIKF
ncbi:TonB-dependent receptor [Ekhidna sp.]|uniref:TonB-dependent receptor plug domain-containing protein n=1 Tax=Ekhidna sp. TaxID=2608089 RepID=UPI003296A26A